MNLYLVQIIIKFLRMLFIAFISFFNITLYAERENVAQNTIINKKDYAVNTVVIKEEKKIQPVKKTVQKTTPKTTTKQNIIPAAKTETKQEKVEVVVNEQPVEQVQSNVIETFTGRLTGYGPDCAGCSGYGNLACRTKEKGTFILKTNGIYYNDSKYGKVRILAAATSKFRCGTIITVTKPGQTPFNAVVLDTGGSMRKAWSQGNVWMDLAYSTEAMAGSDNLTGHNIKFEVLRYGW